jgi:hypothetical protein
LLDSGIDAVVTGLKPFQGKAQSLDVGADVLYPEGRGKMIRYRGGVQLGPAGFDTWRTVLTVSGAMGGMIVLSKPAKVKLKLPVDVEESVDDGLPIVSKIVWKLGDPSDPVSVAKPRRPTPTREAGLFASPATRCDNRRSPQERPADRGGCP